MHHLTARQCGLPSLLSLAIALAAVPHLAVAAAAAPEQQQVLRFDIAAQSLDAALAAFSAVTRTQVLVSAELTRDLHSPGVSGSYVQSEALARLLAGTGLAARFVDGDTVTLEPLAQGGRSLALGATTITSRSLESATGHVDGYVAQRSATATKTDSGLLDVPQTVNVITQDEIKVRGSQSVTEALRYTPGISTGGFVDRSKSFDEPTSRGFSPTPLYLDGLHLPYGGGSIGGALQVDPYTLERIEVLKGPASVLYGRNEPGGVVNMVSKRPSATPVREVVLGGGSYDRHYGALDIADSLDEQKTYLYRLTLLGSEQGSEIDYAQQQRFLIAPSFTWNIGDRTALTLYGQYQKDNDVPESQGLPSVGSRFDSPNGKIKRSRFIGDPDTNAFDREQFVIGYEFSHELNDTWTLRQNSRYAYVDDHYVAPLHGYGFVANPLTGENDQSHMTRYGVNWAQTNKVFGMDNTAQARFNTGDIEHTVLIGLDYYHFASTFLGLYSYEGESPIIDLYAPVYGQSFTFGSPNRWHNTITQTGLYVQDQLKWNQWFVTLGGRYDWAETDNNRTQPRFGVVVDTKAKDEKFTGRIGAGYAFESGVTPYVSYSESFLPTSGTDWLGNEFEPYSGKQYEAGIKYQPPGQNSFIQVSVYQIDQKNVLTSDEQNPGFSSQSAEQRSRGFEVEGKASLSNNLGIIAAFSRNDIEYTKDNDGREGRHPAGVPPMTASLWLDYALTGDTMLAGLGAGIGARYVGQTDGTTTASNHFTVPAYTVYDAMLSYDFGKSRLNVKGLKLQMNVENLTDKEYISGCTGVWECFYGRGRTVTSNLTYAW
ncbi:TonB-dependent siderophore receptor [Pseudomonas sp. LRF_L74]|uniref:TonB-dependent siderophore receptor n=1 Tax=Pseudomonas sp. LRF_L74 TaxID=3369422 RepID=UPI003F5DAD96